MSEFTPLIRRAVPVMNRSSPCSGKAVHELHVNARPDVFLPYDADALRTWFAEIVGERRGEVLDR